MTDTTPAASRPNAFWMIALGILMIVLGVVGIGMAAWLTLAAVLWFGVLAIVAGVAQLIDVVHHKGWKAIVWHVLIALLYVVAGVLMILLPVRAALILTIVLAAVFVGTGLMRLVMAFTTRGLGAGGTLWLVVSAILSIALGVILYGMVSPPGAEVLATPEGQLAWMRSWGWVIGLFISIELIVQGLALLSLGIVARGSSRGTGSGTAGAAPA